MEEEKVYHRRYLRAISNPTRRQILQHLKSASLTREALQSKTNLSSQELKWHLNILADGHCIQKQTNKNAQTYYTITQEGLVIDFLD